VTAPAPEAAHEPAQAPAARKIGLLGAVGIGVGSMLGAGVFAVWGPASLIAGQYLIAAVVVAGAIALVNAMSSAQLAAAHPVAGGAYTFGRRELSESAGFAAGFAFVLGKTASIAAMGLAIGHYVLPGQPALIALLAIALAWSLNARSITRTSLVTGIIAAVVLASLLVFVVAAQLAPPAATQVAWDESGNIFVNVGGAAALIFFAFAGYARIATLGEEVREPARTLPRAILIAIGVVLVTYLVVALALERRLGTLGLWTSKTPLADAVRGTFVPVAVVAVVAAVAAFGAMVALLAGIGRTAMAMARERDLPEAMATQGARGVPWFAEGVCAMVATVLAVLGNLTFALSISSFAVLLYYAIANMAAVRQARRGGTVGFAVPWQVSAAGAGACVLLAFMLPTLAVLAGVLLIGGAVLARLVVRRGTSPASA